MEETKKNSKGAGILPYSIIPTNNKINFLFHKTFTGKKINHLIDFGGAVDPIEIEQNIDLLYVALRELCEESLGLIFSKNIEEDFQTNFYNNTNNDDIFIKFKESEIKNFPYVEKSIKNSYEKYSKLQHDLKGDVVKTNVLNYVMYFIKIDYFDTKPLNNIYENYMEKKREFVWVDIDDIIENKTILPLLERVEKCENLIEIMKKIKNL